MNDKVKLSEIVEALLRGEWLSRRDLANRIQAHGIEQPSIDALIAEIDAVERIEVSDFGYVPCSDGDLIEVFALKNITDKYRGQK